MTINFHDIHWKNLASSDFWFSVDRINLHLVDWAFLTVGLILVALSLLVKLLALYTRHPVTKKLLNRFFRLFFWIGICEALWFALRYQNAGVVGTHAVAALILLIGLASAIPVLSYWFTKYGRERDAWDKQQVKLKYLNK
jgi:hypothetical protein